MSDSAAAGQSPSSQSLNAIKRIDTLCDRFEAAWQNGNPPEWDLDHTGLPEEDREILFEEYLRIELHYRAQRGDLLDVSEYTSRYPQYASAIKRVFQALGEKRVISTSFLRKILVQHEDDPSNQKRTSTNYDILRAHALGGLGRVTVAVDRELGREVALKLLQDKHLTDPLAQGRFIREAQLTARLEHPGVVPIHGLGIDQSGIPFYAMRFVNGQTFREAILQLHQSPGAWHDPQWMLEMRRLLSSFVSVCHTIEYAHSRGVVHRDIKPSNILIGEFGETLVVDWGMASDTSLPQVPTPDVLEIHESDPLELTQTGAVVGTPAFMSPEQASGNHSSPTSSTDIYALGATLANLLGGHPPVHGENSLKVIEKVQQGDLQYPRDLLHLVPASIDAVCRKALSYHPDQRYSTARQLASDIELWLAGEPVSAYPEPWWQSIARFLSRHRTFSSATAAALVVVVCMVFLARHWTEQASQRVRLVGLVDGLATADLGVIPNLLNGLENVGPERRALLLKRLSATDPASKAARNLRFALTSGDDAHSERLVAEFLQCSPDDYLSYCECLRPHAQRLLRTFWEKVQDQRTSPQARLKSAGILALVDPHHQAWQFIGDDVALILCREPATWYGLWQTVFRPVAVHLQPALRRIFEDSQNREMSHSAAQLLGLLVRDNAKLLVELLQKADREQMAPLIRGLAERRESSIPELRIALRDQSPIPQPPGVLINQRLPYIARDRRRARAACALLALEQAGDVWPLLVATADPTFRSNVIELVPYAGIAPHKLWEWYTNEIHTTRRRTLLLMLGSFPRSSISNQERLKWSAEIQRVERHDSDPGVHAAAQWVLRSWNVEAHRAPMDFAGYSENRRWYEVSTGETFVIIHGPVEFLMGSPQDECFRDPADELHLRRINHSWAIASREVTHERAAVLVPSLANSSSEIPSGADFSESGMTWYDAARYCRRLSEKEGIPEDQMCFPPIEKIGPQMQLPENYFQRTGYRIPSQSEWEYACRAGTITATYFGDDPELYSAYTVNATNSNATVAKGGEKKPNDLGLFDTLGNVFEWCYDRCEGQPYSQQPEWARTVVGKKVHLRIAPRRTYSIRGGDSGRTPNAIRSSLRNRATAENLQTLCGFRPVRTLPTDWQPFDVVRVLDVPADEVRYRICGHGHKFRIETFDPHFIVGPLSGVTPAEISVRSPNKDSHQFSFTLVQTATGYHRTVSGQVAHIDWNIQVSPTTLQSKPDPEVHETQIIDTDNQLNEVHFSRLIPPAGVGDRNPAGSSTFAVIASARPKLPPGEYYVQIYGDNVPRLSVDQYLSWTRPEGKELPISKIDATLRVSIREPGDIWKAKAVTSNGKADLWINVRPVPTLP